MPRSSVAYDDDFFAWTQEQAQLLRGGAFSEIDIANTAEELEDMGRSVRNEVKNRLAVLLMHLLKWQYQPVFRSRSWSSTLLEQRVQIKELLDESPSLSSMVTGDLSGIYVRARLKAVGETGFAESTFPQDCPFTPEQILSEDFLLED